KKAEAKLREEEKGVTIIAALWKYDEKAKLVEPGVHVRRTKNTKACLDELLEQANNDYHESNAEADELTWANIQLLADCSGASNDYASLSYFDHSKPLYEMFEEFRKQKLTTESNLKASVVKIRIVIIASDSDYLNSRALQSSRKQSLKRARADTTSLIPALGSKKPSVLHSTSIAAGDKPNKYIPSSKVVLKSAFKPQNSAMPPPPLPASRWSRNLPMQKYTFTRLIASVLDDGEVVFTQSAKEEVIEIATDWIH
ncbi:hypothetical protein C0995_000416, partial [Termitomyces sp. Mi166